MRRRRLLLGSAGALAGLATTAWVWPNAALSPPASLDAALRWIDRLQVDATARTLEGWPLPEVLEHLAQSIDYSIDGYPLMHGEWFRSTAGALAFGLFQRVGAMRHDLQAPIPGATPLRATDNAVALAALRRSIERFRDHRGTLAPHFAYGALHRDDYARAHLMHLADHGRWILPHAW